MQGGVITIMVTLKLTVIVYNKMQIYVLYTLQCFSLELCLHFQESSES